MKNEKYEATSEDGKLYFYVLLETDKKRVWLRWIRNGKQHDKTENYPTLEKAASVFKDTVQDCKNKLLAYHIAQVMYNPEYLTL